MCCKKFIFLLWLLFAGWVLSSCSQKGLPVTLQHPALQDGKYDAAPPAQGISEQLDKISRSVYRLNVIAFYESYTFTRGAGVTLRQFKTQHAEEKAEAHTISNESVLGTATVIYAGKNRAVLLTCAHVVHFPDTVVSYYPDSLGIVRRISVKIKQKSYVAGLNNPNVTLLASDTEKDIALLEAHLSADEDVQQLPVIQGKSSDLNWGTFVYVLGFPNGEKMVESGIVSKPDKKDNSYFITNAIFNRGISGGPVFALRDGASGIEWVGMAKSAPATDIFYLQPAVNKKEMYSKSESYKGDVFINKKKMINYGITYSVSMKEIVRFVESIGSELNQEGFDIQQFFYHPPE